jgi:NADH-quinone oxidoreductase subunit N
MIASSPFSEASLISVATLAGTGIAILLLELWRMPGGSHVPRRFLAWVSLTSLVVAAALTLMALFSGQPDQVQGMLGIDGPATWFALFLYAAGAAIVLTESGLPANEGVRNGGGYALILFAILGALLVVQSIHMLPLAIGLAMLYTASGALLGPRVAWGYIAIQGAGLASVLMGGALLYGATGSLQMDIVIARLSYLVSRETSHTLVALGAGLFITGLCLPLGILPFHTWRPEIYCRSWLPGGMLVSLTLHVAAISVLSRFHSAWDRHTIALFAILGSWSVVIGPLNALRSYTVQDTLAHLATAQSGGLILALASLPATLSDTSSGWPRLVYLLASSSLGVAGLWSLAANARRRERLALPLQDIAGLGLRRPWVAITTTVCVLSAVGVPPLSGWIAQLGLVQALIVAGYGGAAGAVLGGAVLGGLNAGRWLLTIWTRPHVRSTWVPSTPEIALIAVATAAGTLLAGLYAEAIYGWIARLAAP